MPRQMLIQCRVGTAAEWTASAAVLKLGEWGYSEDTFTLKIGDGVSTFDELVTAVTILG